MAPESKTKTCNYLHTSYQLVLNEGKPSGNTDLCFGYTSIPFKIKECAIPKIYKPVCCIAGVM